MKLYLNETSPFARWILVCALEYGVDLELVWVDPWAVPDGLKSLNPFSTVPVLQTPTGEALYESSLIVRYLLPSVSQGSSLEAYRRLAVGKMLLETAFRHVSLACYQIPEALSHPLIEQTQQTLVRVLQTLSVADLPTVAAMEIPDLASLQLAVGLDYLAFRRSELVANGLNLALVDRLAEYQSRSSFYTTTPHNLALVAQGRLALLN